MTANVDKSGCIACELCVEICPQVFRLGDDGFAEAYAPVTPELIQSATDARDSCPVAVIDIQE